MLTLIFFAALIVVAWKLFIFGMNEACRNNLIVAIAEVTKDIYDGERLPI